MMFVPSSKQVKPLIISKVTTELREVPVEELTMFMDEFNHLIFDMVSSADVNEKKGAILAIGRTPKQKPNYLYFTTTLE